MAVDVQNKVPALRFKLTRVGIRGVRKPVFVERGGKLTTLAANIDVFVDLPASKKGVHMSRNIEAVNEILDRSIEKPVKGVENLCANIAKQLLSKHDYANRSEVRMEAEYFLECKTPSGALSTENYTLIGRAVAERGKEVKKAIGVEVTGMSACPCAIEAVRELLPKRKYPVITHNQRNVSRLIIEVPEEYDIEANDLIRLVESSMSSPTYELLKKRDEAKIVLQAHRNPKFVEDIVRDILAKILKNYSYLPDDVVVELRSESEESIHKHNAFAERITTLGELRK
ncbi:MAG: GTP cyclohydrolase MptA [Candidatus Thermoplasmatota archaeon]|nr:GTP cyclohydrolase MptA [Candidatus Thermoplasmatota archaeon]